MNGPTQSSVFSAATKAAWTVLLVAVVAFVAWQLLQRLVVALVVMLILVGIFRWLMRGRL